MKQILFLALFGVTTCICEDALAQRKYIAVFHTNGGKRYNGVLTETNQEGFTIKTRNGAMRFFDADTVGKLKIRSKHALNNNMLLGITLGLAGGALLYNNQESKGNVTPMVLPVIIVGSVVGGAGFGGFINSFFSKEKFENISANYPEVQPKLAPYAVPVK